MNDCTCSEHKSVIERLKRMEKELEKHKEKTSLELDKQREKDDSMAMKLNLIFGGIIISPFIVALLTLLIKTPS